MAYRNLSTLLITLSLLLSIQGKINAQEKWDLQKCVSYAIDNNISVKQANLQTSFASLDYLQSKMNMHPSANFSSSAGLSSGRNQDPTTFSLITTGYVFNNVSLQAGIDLFNWFSKKNTVVARTLGVEAAAAGLEKAKNDVALNVAVAYLQVLLAKEQINLAKSKILLTASQLESTKKQVEAGKLPELNAATIESQLATDSAGYVGAEANANRMLLQLKALLNVDAGLAMDIATPRVDKIPVESLGDLQPEAVYNLALQNLPQQKADILNVKSAIKLAQATKAGMYPTFSLFGSLGTAFNNKANAVKSKTEVLSPVGTVKVDNANYQVFPLSPFDVYTYGKIGYFDQLNQNFRQSVGLNLSVPIFSNGNLRNAWRRSKLNVQQAELNKEQNSVTLKQDIYKAYNDAIAAMQTFNANNKVVATSETTANFAVKRHELGLISTYELVNVQNNLQQARINLLYAQYDYVFKMKLLEFYKGQGLKL